MRRLIRPAAFTAVSIAAIVGFALAGRLVAEPLDWNHIGGWLDLVEPVDALAEIARWIGLGLALYVTIVSSAALLAEIAGAVRMPRIHRALRCLVGLVALPVLRRRLLEFTTAATITATSLQAAPTSAALAPTTPIALVAERPAPPASIPSVRGEFHGFGISAARAGEFESIGTHAVREGDTLSDIIRDHYGYVDAALLREVVHANPQIIDPDLILVGWRITLPDLSAVPDPAPVTTVHGEATWTVVTVQQGDTLWEIVDRHYGHATAELVWATVDANPTLDDPNLIYLGQQITLPPIGDQTPAPSTPAELVPPPVPAAEPAPPPTGLLPAPTSTTKAESLVPSLESELAAPTRSTLPAAAQQPTTIPSTAAEPPTAATIDEQASDNTDESSRPSIAELIGWTGGAGLAAALLGLAARRRRRFPTRQRHRRPTERAIELGVALRETDNLPTVDWAANALRTLAARLRPRPGEPTSVPRLLRLDGDQIELVWDTPNVDSPAPWQTSDGGWSWTIARTIEHDTTDIPSPCPCLVTIGRRDGADVLLNLESCGTISIIGEPDAASALTRSIATELAASAFADAPTVLIVGGSDLPGDPEHARVVGVPEAVGWLRDRADAASALLAHRRLTSLFALRARSRPRDGHEPVIVIVDAASVDDEAVDRLINLANGDLGAIVVVAGGIHPSITWRLECTPNGVELHPLGLSLDGVGFNPELECLIEEIIPVDDPSVEELDEFDEDLGVPELAGVLADHLEIVHVRDEGSVAPAASDDEWDVELKVLGQVACIGSKEPLTPTELHLAIYLAFHRNGENSDTIATMVWPNGAADRTITNTMASLRRKLGTGSDGEMLFPLGRDNQYVYRLSPRVTTDWDRFLGLMKTAIELPPDEAVQLLDQAMSLIDGPPFRAPSGYSWAYSDGIATLMTETIAIAARQCVELHIEGADLLAAGAAAWQGVKLTDGAADDPLIARVVEALRLSGQDGIADRVIARLLAQPAEGIS